MWYPSGRFPPLRERKEDIPNAGDGFFINYFNQKYKKKKYVTKETMDCPAGLVACPEMSGKWPM
jgi:transcriptional regulator with PAS, ATPase and Fis domain